MEDEETRPRSSAATADPLPPERAFVVQLRPTDPAGELFVGRIEHIASGTVCRFGSAAELTAFIARIGDPRPQAAQTGAPCGIPPHARRRDQ